MAKILKISTRFLGISLEWFFILVILLAFGIRTSWFQTYLGNLVTNYLTKELNAEFRIEKIDIVFFDKIYLKEVFVQDQHKDTLAQLSQIMVRVKDFSLSGNRIDLRSVGIYNGRIGVERDTLTGTYNYAFIADYFSGSNKSSKKQTPPKVTVGNLSIENVSVTYDDNRKDHDVYGMDYNHLRFNHIYLHISDLTEEESVVSFDIEHLSVYEKSGLWLDKMRTHCTIDPHKGLLFSDVDIKTSRSRIYCSKLNLLMVDLEGVHDFEDSVTFDARLDSASVSMRDISLFAPELEGMTEQVSLKAEVSRKVRDLLIEDLDLRFGKRTVVRGNYSLPDFRELTASKFNEWIDYAYIDFEDLENLVLPKIAGVRRIKLDTYINRLEYAEFNKTHVYGSVEQFNLQGNKLATVLGTVRLPNELTFKETGDGVYAFNHTTNSDYDIYIDTFNLGKFLDDDEFGYVRGKIWADGIIGEKDIVRLTKLTGHIDALDFHQYIYHQIDVTEGSWVDNTLDANVVIDDPNLQLTFNGKIETQDELNFAFESKVGKANLGVIHFSPDAEATFSGGMNVYLKGHDLNDYQGFVVGEDLDLIQDKKPVYIPRLSLSVVRGDMKDDFQLRSSLVDADLTGKIHFETFFTALNNGLAEALPAFFERQEYPGKKNSADKFVLDATTKSTDDFMAVFMPEMRIDNGSTIHFEFNSEDNNESLILNATQISYKDLFFKDEKAFIQDVHLVQSFESGNGTMNLYAGRTQISDSLFVRNFQVDLTGTNNQYESQITWNENLSDSALFRLNCTIVSAEEFQINLHKDSYFGLKGNHWEILSKSELNIQPNRYAIDHLMLERDAQFLAINGVLSDSISDVLDVRANDLHLEEFTSLLGAPVDIQGALNADVSIQTPFTDIKAKGEVLVQELKVKGFDIGDVHVNGDWIDAEKKFSLVGDLRYLKNETFDFSGFYFPLKEKNSLDFNLLFKNMDLAFTNAFVDEDVISDIKGKIKGEVKVTGELENVQIDGKTQLLDAGLKVGILGTHYNVSGPIQFDGENDGIFGVLPVSDDEGNQAYAVATIFHNDFSDFSVNFDLTFDESVKYFRNPLSGQTLNYTGRFLALNTGYEEGTIYYGKAYASGTASILIAKGQTVINVSAKTEQGTLIHIPMYGSREIEEFDFISFKQDSVVLDPKVDLTGVDLNLEIQATPDANIELILNPQTDEIIKANGSGKLNIQADNYGQVKMDGVYTINSGEYNFVLGVIRKPFKLAKGGTISWSGDPYEAGLNITTYYSVMASLAELNPSLANSDNISKKEVQCVLEITQTLSNPNIRLDINVPNVSESERPELERIRSDKDELQKQFFTLLIARRFQGKNTNSTNQNGLADVLAQQLNYLLDQMSKNVKMNVAYDNNSVTGDKKFQFGMQRAFGDKQNIILKTSLGVNNNSTTGTNSSTLIGDFSLEYLITQDGNFRVNIFNESNDKGVLSNKDKGDFTQGVGLHYQENFNEISESRFIEFFSNLFRSDKKVDNSKRKKRVPVSVVPVPPQGGTKEEDSGQSTGNQE